jgi:DNA-binding response OmpR family regulator
LKRSTDAVTAFVAQVSPASTVRSRSAEAHDEPPPTILAVDDEPELLSMLDEYLVSRGYRVLTASNVQRRAFDPRNTKIGLVLLDITLPGEDGLSLARHLREHGGPPVILVTALGTALDRIVGLEVGADDYVTKPFELRELLLRIKNVLRRSAP